MGARTMQDVRGGARPGHRRVRRASIEPGRDRLLLRCQQPAATDGQSSTSTRKTGFIARGVLTGPESGLRPARSQPPYPRANGPPESYAQAFGVAGGGAVPRAPQVSLARGLLSMVANTA